MQKLIFGITSLTLGGAERVLVDIANELSSKYDITVFTLYGKGEFEKDLNNNIKIVTAYEKSYNEMTRLEKIKVSLKLLFNKKKMYSQYIYNEYDTEIAFLEGPITRLFSIRCNNAKKIAWVHNDIKLVFGKGITSKIKRVVDKKCYSKYDDIIFVSNDNKKKFEETYNLSNNKAVITNYISEKRVKEQSLEPFDNIYDAATVNFLTVARLTEQKAIDRLVKVHKELIDNGISHKIFCIGDGPEKERLQNLITYYNVKNTFVLLGKKENPYPYIKNCDIFALLSNYEGFPMTILEARILNKPIVITNTSAREAVSGYKKSYITENTDEGVYEGIKKSIEMLPEWKKTEQSNYNQNNDIISQIEKLVN